MKFRIPTLIIVLSFFVGNALAQSEDITEAEKCARLRASAYADALGLDAKATGRLVQLFLKAEDEVAPLREQCAVISTKVEEAMVPFDAQAVELLNKEQRAKLEALKKEGKWAPAAANCGHHEGSVKGCAGHGRAAAGGGGCCAGKAGAGATAPAQVPQKRTPTPTSDPDPK